MFTGLITDLGEIVSIEPRGELQRMRIATHYSLESLHLGQSIACSGPCLTVVAKGYEDKGYDASWTWFEIDVGLETLARTSAKFWQVGTRLNLESSVRLGDEMGGHLVTGHVDGMAVITKREDFDGMARFDVQLPSAYAKYIAEKGSISLDGTSLTINSVSGSALSVLLIPHTLAETSWGLAKVGDTLNFEVDLIARYTERLLSLTPHSTAEPQRAPRTLQDIAPIGLKAPSDQATASTTRQNATGFGLGMPASTAAANTAVATATTHPSASPLESESGFSFGLIPNPTPTPFGINASLSDTVSDLAAAADFKNVLAKNIPSPFSTGEAAAKSGAKDGLVGGQNFASAFEGGFGFDKNEPFAPINEVHNKDKAQDMTNEGFRGFRDFYKKD